MAKTLEIVRPVFVGLRPVLAAKRFVRLAFAYLARLPRPAAFILGAALLGILAAGVPIVTIRYDIHFDTFLGYTRQTRISDSSKFLGAFALGFCVSCAGAAWAWDVCDKFRWAIAVPITYTATFFALLAIWYYGGF